MNLIISQQARQPTIMFLNKAYQLKCVLNTQIIIASYKVFDKFYSFVPVELLHGRAAKIREM